MQKRKKHKQNKNATVSIVKKTESLHKPVTLLDDSGLAFGESLFLEIMKRDPASHSTKWIFLVTTTALLLTMPSLDVILQYIINDAQQLQVDEGLLAVSARVLHLSEEQLMTHLYDSLMGFVVLSLLHIIGVTWPRKWYDKKINKYATICYDEMFAEPLSCYETSTGERPVLIARWGNTISNAFYVASGICVTHSVYISQDINLYYLADGLFGINLLLLAVFSTVWHAANYNKEHYLDLWAMDHAILYLIFRYIAMGMNWAFAYHHPNTVALGLFIFYVVSFGAAFTTYWKEVRCDYGVGKFDKCFPPAGRRRLTKLDENGVPDMLISGTCFFSGLPIIYMCLPALIMMLLGKIGSPIALNIACLSLTIGWSYRMTERFCMDGLTPLTWINQQLRPSKTGQTPSPVNAALLRLMAAILSPTAALHWSTGITLFTGFVHVRSLDHQIAEVIHQLHHVAEEDPWDS